MKRALLIYKSNKYGIFNIGDYIQSLAASQFFNNKIDIFINREHLDEYVDNEVKMIMNGWFMSEPTHWPPSEKIYPLFVSFHITISAKKELLSKKSISYFKVHEPIGCRDMNTLNMLKMKGINAYFSACLTLTLGRSYKYNLGEQRIGLYFVDAYFEVQKDIYSLYKMVSCLIMRNRIIYTLTKRRFVNLNFKNLLRTASFYESYHKIFDKEVLLEAEYISHVVSEKNYRSEVNKFNYARVLLEKYSRAKYVVTSRIHCAIPCLGMDTPVLFIYNINQRESSSCRFNGILELLHIISYDNGKMGCLLFENKIQTDSKFENKVDYRIYRDRLIETCLEFAK